MQENELATNISKSLNFLNSPDAWDNKEKMEDLLWYLQEDFKCLMNLMGFESVHFCGVEKSFDIFTINKTKGE